MDELTYNGKKFSEFDTFFDGSKAFGSPEKDYEIVEIMGRNGGLSIYNNRFKDIVLPFPCFVRSAFLTHYRQLVEFLNSQHGYLRLETSKEPNHFRKALFQGIVDPQTTPFNHGGQFTINFLAKPQRFLKSGETPVSSQSQSHSYDGNPVSISNPSGLSAVSSLAVDLEPIQDTSGGDPSPTNICPIYGYDVKNLLKYPYVNNSTSFEQNGITWTINSDGSVKCKGTASVISYCWLYGSGSSSLMSTLKEGDEVIYSVQIDGIGGVGRQFILYGSPSVIYGNTDAPFTIPSMSGYNGNGIVLYVSSGSYVDATVYPMIRPAYISDDTFVPYKYGMAVKRTGKNIYDTNWGYIGISRRTWGTGDDALLALLNSLTAGTYTFIMKATVDAVDSSSNDREVCGIFLNSQASINVRATFTTSDFKVGANLTAVKTFTINANQVGKFTNVYYYASANNASNDKTTITDIGLFVGTQTDYEPYSGTVYPVKFHTGKNLLNMADIQIGKAWNATSNNDRATVYMDCEPDTNYAISINDRSAFSATVWCEKESESATTNTYLTTFSSNATYFKTKSTSNVICIQFSKTNVSASDFTGVEVQIEKGTVNTPYEAYGTGISTIYGGSLDIVSGVLTVDRASVQSSNASDYVRNNGTQYYMKSASASGIKSPSSAEATVISDKFKQALSGASGVAYLNTGGNIRFNTADSYNTVQDMLDAVGAIQFVYPLATPITYNLTPTQVSLLTGTNVITSDSGDMTVTVTEPSLLVNPTLFESKPLLRIYGTGTVNINDQYITISAHSFPYIDIDCELMDAYYGSSNANQYVTFSTNDYITLRSGNNYIAYGNQIEVTPRWYEI